LYVYCIIKELIKERPVAMKTEKIICAWTFRF